MNGANLRQTVFFKFTVGLIDRLQLPGDLLLLIYFAVIARQYFWFVTDHNAIAWLVSAVLALLAASLYVVSRPKSNGGTSTAFWLIAVLPLVCVYAMRVAVPDVSFDVLNYRILHAERSMRGLLFFPTEFFPTPAPYNPTPDMVTGLFRHVLGYRLGTIVNLLAMIWVAQIIDKLLRPYLENAWWRALGVLIAVFAEHVLFEINNYMADLLALPLLLEATYLAIVTLQDDQGLKEERKTLVRIAVLLGLAATFKLTNLTMAFPIVLLCGYVVVMRVRRRWTTQSFKRLAVSTLLCAVAFIVSILPFSIYLQRLTGSPVFPVLNGIFKSPYWPASNVWDPRWGPKGLGETILWPILISAKPARLSELAVYSGKISVGFVLAIFGLILTRDSRFRQICFLLSAGALLWSCNTGYIRYALYLETMAGIVLVTILAWGFQQRRRRLILAFTCLLVIILAGQTGFALSHIWYQEWSQRPTAFTHPGIIRREARHLLRDQSLRAFQDDETLAQIDRVEVWIGSSVKTSALASMLRRDAPVLGINQPEFFAGDAGRLLFESQLRNLNGKRMFSLVFKESLDPAKAALRDRGFEIVKTQVFEIPYYSTSGRIPVALLEVKPPAIETGTSLEANSGALNPLPDAGYRAQITPHEQPAFMTSGRKHTLRLTIKNLGSSVWPASVREGWMGVVTLGNRWLTSDGAGVVNEVDSRVALPYDLQAGQEVQLTLDVTPPAPGQYVLELDMVHEGVTWFYQRGSNTVRWRVTVQN